MRGRTLRIKLLKLKITIAVDNCWSHILLDCKTKALLVYVPRVELNKDNLGVKLHSPRLLVGTKRLLATTCTTSHGNLEE